MEWTSQEIHVKLIVWLGIAEAVVVVSFSIS